MAMSSNNLDGFYEKLNDSKWFQEAQDYPHPCKSHRTASLYSDFNLNFENLKGRRRAIQTVGHVRVPASMERHCKL